MKDNRKMTKSEKWDVGFCVLMLFVISLGCFIAFLLIADLINNIDYKKNLIDDTILNKYKMELVESNYSANEEFQGPYLAKNKKTNEIQETYILHTDNTVSLYTKQNDNYVEVAH